MNAFTHPAAGFAGMSGHEQSRELRRTRTLLAELLTQPRSAFPAVRVVYGGADLSEQVLDDCLLPVTMARQAAARTGRTFSPAEALAAFAKAIPWAMREDASRQSRGEAPPMIGPAHRAAQAEGLPNGGLPAPLFLELGEVPLP